MDGLGLGAAGGAQRAPKSDPGTLPTSSSGSLRLEDPQRERDETGGSALRAGDLGAILTVWRMRSRAMLHPNGRLTRRIRAIRIVKKE